MKYQVFACIFICMWPRPIIDQLWPDISQSIFRAKESNHIQTIELTSFLWEYKYMSRKHGRTCMKHTAFLMHPFFWDDV